MRKVIAELLGEWATEVEEGLTLNELGDKMREFCRQNEIRAQLPEYRNMFHVSITR